MLLLNSFFLRGKGEKWGGIGNYKGKMEGLKWM